MKKFFNIIGKILIRLVPGIISLVLFMVFLLYLPPVQDLLVPQVLKLVNKPGEMEISLSKFRLYFPLDIAVDSLRLHTPAMAVSADRATADMAVLPLLRGVVNAEELRVDNAKLRLGTPDSALYMNASLELATIEDTRVRLSSKNVVIGDMTADNGIIEMAMRPDTVPKPKTDDSDPAYWHITLNRGSLTRINYNMTYEPTITDLNCTLADGTILGVDVDMATNTLKVKDVAIKGVDARYIYPTAEYLAAHPVVKLPEDTIPSVPWTVTCDRITLSESTALYALSGAKPLTDNFDLDYIQASEIDIQIDSFMNRATTVHAPIRRIYARERCGIPVELKGLFDMDSVKMQATDMVLTTASSTVELTAMMGLDSINTPFAVNLNADISNDDIRRLAPAAISPIVDGLPRGVPLSLIADASGTMNDINIRNIALEIPRHLALEANGRLQNITDLQKAVGEIDLTGSMPDGAFIKPTLMDAKLARTVNLPPMTLDGTVNFNRGDIAGDVEVTANDGSVALVGEWHNREKGYALNLEAVRFPMQSILPALGVSDVTASLDLSGVGLDPFSAATTLQGALDLQHVGYQGASYNNVTATVALADGNATVSAASANRGAHFSIDAAGNLIGDTLRWRFDSDIKDLDLEALHLMDTTAVGSVLLAGNATFTLPKTHISRIGKRKVVTTTPMTFTADIDANKLYWRMADGTFNTDKIAAQVSTDSTHTMLDVDNGDLCLRAFCHVGLDTLLSRLDKTTTLLNHYVDRRQIAIDTLQQTLPPFDIALTAGGNNILSSYLYDSDIHFEHLDFKAVNDSLLSASAVVGGFSTGDTRLDSIDVNMRQHGKILMYNLQVNNRPGTFDQFAHIDAKGYLGSDKFSLLFRQENIDEETGYSFGSVITMPEAQTFALRFVPYHPIIGYQDWEINRDNYISYNISSHHIDANIDLKSSKSSVKLFTEHNEADSAQEALHLQIQDLKIEDWLAINPFAPPIKGDLSADMTVAVEDKSINGSGTVSLADLYYGHDKVGDFDMELDLATNAAGTIRATTTLMVDGVKTITASGNLNDSTAINPFMLDFKMIHFPLAVLNPFLPSGTAKLGGMLNGEMDITGKLSDPTFNGWLNFDSTAVNVDMLGSSFDFSDVKIPVKENIVTFDNFAITAVNENPLRINGTADIADLSNIKVDLKMNANNTQLVGSKRKRGQDVYGKAYINLDASVKGSLARFLNVKANLKVLPGTNATYVIPDVQSAITSQSNADMVTFVNFSDTTAVAADTIPSTGLVVNLDASVDISEGSTLAVDLSSDGKNRAQVQANGRINYSLDYLGDERVTGRVTINQGYVRYGMAPVMSEKLFQIEEGSNVVFNGQMLNPTLNLHAYDEMKANVTDDGNSRQVTFNVGVDITGTLEQMNVTFDLSAPDDISVQDELTSMSSDQRANQAMNMLLYGSYTGPGTKGSTLSNPLYTFLAGQLNSLASSAITGIDISFGIDQLDRTVDGVSSTAMSYSYKVSKSLFDDRFKIVVGGNYTTDAEADENFAQNLIADISFEYLLNPQGTMLVKLFRHTGYESILEGEITQTGVGFVYKKKMHSLKELFDWLPIRRKNSGNLVVEEGGKQ